MRQKCLGFLRAKRTPLEYLGLSIMPTYGPHMSSIQMSSPSSMDHSSLARDVSLPIPAPGPSILEEMGKMDPKDEEKEVDKRDRSIAH